VEEVSKKF